MQTPKHAIEYLLEKYYDGVSNKEFVKFLIENKYTKCKDYHNVLRLIIKRRRQYRIENNELIINEKFNNKLITINKKYRNKEKEVI